MSALRRAAGAVIGIAAAAAVLAGCGSTASTGASAPDSPTPTASVSVSVSASAAAPTCPARFQAATDLWVPALPQGVDGSSALVPIEVPSAVVVCAYRHADQAALTGGRVLSGNLATVSNTLTVAPAKSPAPVLACPLYLRAVDEDNYLIGLDYPTGSIWVSAPMFHCQSSSNGVFVSSENLGATASAWYDSGLPMR